jgi:hypothetical protein
MRNSGVKRLKEDHQKRTKLIRVQKNFQVLGAFAKKRVLASPSLSDRPSEGINTALAGLISVIFYTGDVYFYFWKICQ